MNALALTDVASTPAWSATWKLERGTDDGLGGTGVANSMYSPLCHNCDKTLSVLAVGVSFRAKSRRPKLLETNENERKL